MKSILLFVNLNPDFRKLYQAILSSELFKVTVLATSKYALSINSIDERLCNRIYIINQNVGSVEEEFKNIDNAGWLSDLDRYECLKVSRRRQTLEDTENNTIALLHKIFQENQIHFIVNEMVANMCSYLLSKIGSTYGVPYVSLMGSRFPGYITIGLTDGSDEADLYKKKFELLEKKELEPSNLEKNFIRQYLINFDSTTPDYMKISGMTETSFLNAIRRLIKNVIELFGNFRIGLIFPYDPFLGYVYKYSFLNKLRTLKRVIRCQTGNIKYDSVEDEKFVMYPLHYHPEASTSVLSWANFNEIDIIRTIACSLPRNFKLYVKDHPTAKGFLSFRDYRRIKSIPNVRLIDAKLNSKYLIRKSYGVITLTSTVGYEALILGKPVISMGNIFYNFHPLCTNVKNLFDLPKAIQQLISTTPTQKYTLNFLFAYLMQSTNISYDFNNPVVLKTFPEILKGELEKIEVIYDR